MFRCRLSPSFHISISDELQNTDQELKQSAVLLPIVNQKDLVCPSTDRIGTH